jgi:hypothetical protein
MLTLSAVRRYNAGMEKQVASTGSEGSAKMARANMIELLRVIFCAVVILGHSIPLEMLKRLGLGAIYGSYMVACFFVIGGFFLYKSFARRQGVDFLAFAKNLWLRLAPAMLAAAAVYAVLRGRSLNLLLAPLMLDDGGIGLGITYPWKGEIVFAAWYVVAYFWASLFLFSILSNFERKKAMFIIGIIVMAIFHMIGGGGWQNGAWIAKGLARAIAGMGLGVIAARFDELVKMPRGKFLDGMYSAAEVALPCLIVYAAILPPP